MARERRRFYGFSGKSKAPRGPPTANDERINDITIKKYIREKWYYVKESQDCAICVNAFEPDEEVIALGCSKGDKKHILHKHCLKKMWDFNKKPPDVPGGPERNESKCPYCMAKVEQNRFIFMIYKGIATEEQMAAAKQRAKEEEREREVFIVEMKKELSQFRDQRNNN